MSKGDRTYLETDEFLIIENYIEIPRSSEKDKVGDKYLINLTEPLNELSNEFCKYYKASSLAEDDQEFFAIIFNHDFLPATKTIASLEKLENNIINPILAYSITDITNLGQECLVAIVEAYNYKNNLHEYIKSGKLPSLEALTTFMDNIVGFMKELDDLKIYNLDIAPENIIMHGEKLAFLKEFVTSPAHFYLPNHLIAPELICCHRRARFSHNSKQDIYALGVSMFEAYTGKHPWQDFTGYEEYNHYRLENTTYKTLLHKVKTSEKFRVFFKAALDDDPITRSDIIALYNFWIENNDNFNNKDTTVIGDKSNIFVFNEKNYSNILSVSQALFANWDKSLKVVKEDKLYKWATREQLDKILISEIKSLVDLKSSSIVISPTTNLNEKLSQLLAHLNKGGPIRLSNMSFTTASISFFIHYLTSKFKKDEVDKLVGALAKEKWLDYENNPSALGHLDIKTANKIKEILGIYFANSALRGSLRLVHQLCPNARCRSRMLEKYYVTNVQDMIVAIEKYMSNPTNKFNIDANFIAFLGAKLALVQEVNPIVLQNIPSFKDHPAIIALSYMHLVQDRYSVFKLPNTAKAIVSDLKEMLEDNLHNIEFKKKVLENLESASNSGNIKDIVAALSDEQKFIDDHNGYIKALNKVRDLDARIKRLKKSGGILNFALLFGQKTTVLISYILCLIVTIVVIF